MDRGSIYLQLLYVNYERDGRESDPNDNQRNPNEAFMLIEIEY